MKYYGSLKRVAARLEKLIAEVKTYDRSDLSARQRRQVKKVKNTLECIQENNIDSVSFRCHDLFKGKCGPSTRAYVDGVEKRFLGIKIKEEFPIKEIHVCAEKLEGIDNDYRDALIMHELTHFCGSEHKNEKYFLDENDYQNPRAPLDEQWHESGDQFAYWYLFPFCVPGVDCSDHFFKED